MKILFTGTAALLAGLIVFRAQSAQAQQQSLYQTANRSAERAGASLASYNSFDAGGFDNGDLSGSNYEASDAYSEDSSCSSCAEGDYGGSCDTGERLDLGPGLLNRTGHFYGGVDYLYVRPTFSESTAFVERTQFNNGTVVNRFNELEYDYGSSYRIFGGYRLDCGGEIEFAFTRYQGNGASGMAGPDTTNLPPGVASIEILAGGELVALDPNTRIDVSSNVDLKSYDLGFSKTIPLGSPMTSGHGCSDPCGGCGSCPAWDLKWSAGVRFADVEWDRRATSTTTNTGQPNRSNSTQLDFEGIGPRWGLEGRRYIGKQGRFSLFAKGDISLLLGDVSIESNVNNTQLAFYDSTQLIPVLDIIVGGSMYLGNHVTLTSGYLFSAWQDLGMRDTFPILEQDTGLTFDDANILGFDGYFARAEFSF